MERSRSINLYILSTLAVFVLTAGPVFAASLADLMRDRLTAEVREVIPGDVEIQDIRVLSGEEMVADGAYKLGAVALDGYGGRNRLNFTVELIDKKKSTRKIGVEVMYESMVDVYITAHALAKGTVLGESDFYGMRQRASRLPVGAVMSKKDLIGKPIKINLSEGLVLKKDYLVTAGLVKRGQKVRVEIESGSVFITTKGILRSEGTVGSTVRVYCESSRKEIMGVLVSSDIVRVKV